MNKFAFLVPFYNHPQNIARLVATLKSYDLPVIIVDDGSDERSKSELAKLEGVQLLTRESNGGKGAAMKDGFKFALKNGFTHVLQIDADFQHDAGVIGEFLNESKKYPNALICANPVYDETAPKSRLHGRKITNFWVAINTLGAGIKDAMCGFRLYPLNELKEAIEKSKTNRMEFDIEIIVNAAKTGVQTRWIDTKVRYEKGGVSHFKMFRDNVQISLMHAKCFFSLPKFVLGKIFSTHGKEVLWWKKRERGNALALRISLFLAEHLPSFILNFVIKLVVIFYYIFLKNERKNIAAFRQNLSEFAGEEVLKNTSVFSHFYEFGVAICDKFRVWKGKITLDDLSVTDLSKLKSELVGAERGQILLTSHIGNVEICKALSTQISGFKMVVLVYHENSQKFNEIMSKISSKEVRVMLVNELDVAAMLELKNIVESGVHIGIMGDRVPLSGDKFTRMSFLGKEAKFNHGPYIIAAILGVKISSLWCQKIGDKFRIELAPIAQNIRLGKDRAASVREYLQIYVRELENRCKQTPTQWFNFFDFWR